MAARHDMYRNVHKGLRRALCALLSDAGSAEVTPAAQRAVAERWQAIHALLRAHHHHEDAFIGPHLARSAPSLFAQMERDHHALDGASAALTLAAEQLSLCPPAALAECALSFYRLLASFIGRYLNHMADEENAYLPALQARYNDGELAAIEGELLASIAPDVMGAFLSQMLPAMNTGERFALLDEMRRHAPPAAFTGTCQLAERVLDAASWQALATRLHPTKPALAPA